MKNHPIPTLLFAASMLLSVAAQAQDDHHHEHHGHHDEHDTESLHEQQDAHVHGAADLYLIAEGDTLLLELSSPGMNFLGFESSATTQPQRQAVKALQHSLSRADELFVFSGAGCTLTKADVNLAMLLGAESTHHGEHAHHGHDEHNGKHERHHDAQGKDKGHHAREEHSDISAQYQYLCSNIHNLKSIAVPLMAAYPGLETLQLQWVVGRKQGAQWIESASPVALDGVH